MAEYNSEGEIKEGFLCPVCHKDLRSPENLLSHFQDLHSEEKDLLSSIKDLVGLAKKKILKFEEQDLESFKTEISLQQYFIQPVENQAPGHDRSHTSYFRRVRRDRIDHSTTETNKLIIRLDRLLRVESSDRKQEEQRLVNWLDGTTVTRCPSCTVSFNIARRQHHCRLCGSIMCNSCSSFLPNDVARMIVAPVYSEAAKSHSTSNKNDLENLRVCSHCMGMLESRRYVQMSQAVRPVICQLYERLQQIKSELLPLVDLYNKMYNSLSSGDSTFQLQDAQSLRSTIAKQAESLDAVSKQISLIPLNPEMPRAVMLQNSIRHATSQYIKDHLLTLHVLPTPSEIESIKKKRIIRNIEVPQHSVPTNVKKIAVTTGWTPDKVVDESVPELTEDPLVQQIVIVRNYIEQAKKAHRFEEVTSLRMNLQLLKAAYESQQRGAANGAKEG